MARICGALRDLVPFVQYKKCEKQLTVCNFTKINTPPGVLFTFFKLYKYYQIVQRTTYWKQLTLETFTLNEIAVFIKTDEKCKYSLPRLICYRCN